MWARGERQIPAEEGFRRGPLFDPGAGTMSGQALRIIPLGGLGEIGKNMMILEWQGRIMVIDAGVMFPQNDMWGIDLVIPDFEYLLDKRDQVEGIVITHGHTRGN